MDDGNSRAWDSEQAVLLRFHAPAFLGSSLTRRCPNIFSVDGQLPTEVCFLKWATSGEPP